MRVLVTGNLGYVGTQLTHLLMANRHTVIGCDLNLYPRARATGFPSPMIQLFKDFRDLNEDDLDSVHVVIHLAALSNDSLGSVNPEITRDINHMGSVRLASRAKSAGVSRFIFSSTCSVYGESEGIVSEASPTHPVSEYSLSKLHAEEELATLADDDFHVYLLRSASAYGSSPVFRNDLLINSLSSSMFALEQAEIRSDGSPWRPFIHAEDMARAFQLFAENDPASFSGSPVNVGFNSENYRVHTVGEMIAKLYPLATLSYSATPTRDTGGSYRVSFDKLHRIFPDFTPQYPLPVGLADLRGFLKTIDYSRKDYQERRYVRGAEIDISRLIH